MNELKETIWNGEGSEGTERDLMEGRETTCLKPRGTTSPHRPDPLRSVRPSPPCHSPLHADLSLSTTSRLSLCRPVPSSPSPPRPVSLHAVPSLSMPSRPYPPRLVPFRPVPALSMPFCPCPPRPVPLNLVLSLSTPSRPSSCRPVSLHPFPPLTMPSRPSQPVPSLSILSRPSPSRPVSFHAITSLSDQSRLSPSCSVPFCRVLSATRQR